MTMTRKLSPEPTRTDLTDRECSKLLGSLLGGLCLMSDKQQVRNAVRWWAECDEAWSTMRTNKEVIEDLHRMTKESG